MKCAKIRTLRHYSIILYRELFTYYVRKKWPFLTTPALVTKYVLKYSAKQLFILPSELRNKWTTLRHFFKIFVFSKLEQKTKTQCIFRKKINAGLREKFIYLHLLKSIVKDYSWEKISNWFHCTSKSNFLLQKITAFISEIFKIFNKKLSLESKN